MQGKSKLILAILLILFIVASIPITVYLVRQRQELRRRAAVPEGEATVSLTPETGTYQINQPFTISILFNTANIPISAIAIRITYSYSGTTPEVEASGIEINPTLLTTGDWSCPVKTVTPSGGTVKIDIACVNTSIAGYSNSTDTLLATFDLVANQIPATNPITLSFDPSQSIITRKADGTDILLIPSSTGVYTIAGAGEASPTPTTPPGTPTPTPTTGAGGWPTATPTPTPTPTTPPGTPTPTSYLTPTSTPTTAIGGTLTSTPTGTLEELPETGILTPTLIFLTSGGVLLLIAFLVI